MVKNDEAEPWEVVEFPAIIQDKEGNEKPLWPEFWGLEELKQKRSVLDIRYWNAQYMQNPVSEEGALIKREWWKIWEKEDPPSCEFTIMSLDAAQESNNRADYNALTTWGVFFNEETNNYNIILLNSIKERLEFPELKELVLMVLHYIKRCVVWVYLLASLLLVKGKTRFQELMQFQIFSEVGLYGHLIEGGQKKL
jgi:hypothetical protein